MISRMKRFNYYTCKRCHKYEHPDCTHEIITQCPPLTAWQNTVWSTLLSGHSGSSDQSNVTATAPSFRTVEALSYLHSIA